jgi:PKD repeat protein
MKFNSKSFLFCIIALCIFFSLASQGKAATNVSNSPNTFSTCSRIAVDSLGNIHVAWVEMYSEYSGDCFYARFDIAGQVWSTPLNLSRSARVYAYGERICDIDVDGSNRVYVVWIESNVIKLNTFTGSSWTGPANIASSRANMNAPKIGASSEGNIYVGWGGDDGAIYSRSKVNGSWEDVKAISVPGLRSKFPDIGVGKQVVYMAWMEGTQGGYRAVYSGRNTAANASWSSRGMLPSTGYEEQHPIVVVDSNDNPHFVWTPEITGGGVRRVVYSGWTGSSFSSPEQIAKETVLHYPSLAVRGQTLYACWQVGSYRAGMRIAYNIRQDGEWKGESAVPQSESSTFSDVGASPAGDAAYFIWDAGGEIYFASTKATPENQLPVASFTFSPATGDYPLTVRFDASASYDPDGRIADYGWAFGDGGTGSGRVVKHTYTKKGTFTIRLTVKDNLGGKGEATQTITVLKPNILPEAIFKFSPTTGSYPLEVTFDASSSHDPDGQIVAYDWTFGDGGTGSGKIVKHTYTKEGTFKIQLTVTDDRGGEGKTSQAIKVVKPNVPPKADFSFSPATGIFPLEIAFDASSSYDPDGQIVQYHWDFGDGGTDSGKTIKYIYTKKGTYTVRLTVWDDRDAQSTKEKALIVLSLYPPLNIRWQTFLDRTLFSSWYFTEVRWDKNPENDKIATIVKYRIYRKKPEEGLTAYTSIAEVNTDTFMYRDFDVKGMDLYTYTVTSIDSQGHESPIE